MEKGEPLMMNAKERPTSTVRIAQVITFGVFFTTTVCVCIFFGIKYSNIASDPMQPCLEQQDHKILDKDVRRVTELRKEDGHIISEEFNYDRKSNTVVIHSPGNFSGDAPATLVIEYDQGLAYVKMQDEDNCMVFPLADDLRQAVNMELLAADGLVIDAATSNYTLYTIAGEIPSGFVQSYSGPTVSGLCAGQTMYWLERVDRSEGRFDLRQKRGCWHFKFTFFWGIFEFSWC